MQRVTWEMAQEQGLSQKKACIKTSGPYAHVGAPGFYSRQACSETLRCSGRAGSDNDKIQALQTRSNLLLAPSRAHLWSSRESV